MTFKPSLLFTLPAEVQALFLDQAEKRRFAAGQTLFAPGSVPDAMFCVLEGRTVVTMFSKEGRRFMATELTKGQWFGETPLLDQKERAFHVQAIDDTEVAVVSSRAFWEIVNGYPVALHAVTLLVVQRYRRMLDWIESAALRPLPARLAILLLELCADRDESLGLVAASQEALADHLAVARQSINRLLKGWERDGLVEIHYATLRIIHWAAIEKIALSVK